jgi:hypothetical protein
VIAPAAGVALVGKPASTLRPFHYAVLIQATIVSYLAFGDLPDLWTIVGAPIPATHRLRQTSSMSERTQRRLAAIVSADVVGHRS